MRIAAQFTYTMKRSAQATLQLETITFMQSIPKGTYEIHEHGSENQDGRMVTKTVVLKSVT